jgi:hypothetical protein
MASEAKNAWRGNFMIRLDLHKLEVRPGRIETVLVRTKEQPAADQQLTLGASYVHAGTWRSDVPVVTCSW